MNFKTNYLLKRNYFSALFTAANLKKAEGSTIVGPSGIKMKQPSLVVILSVFNTGLGVKVITFEGKKYRSLARPISESHRKLLKYLGISERVFCWNE